MDNYANKEQNDEVRELLDNFLKHRTLYYYIELLKAISYRFESATREANKSERR